MQQQQQRHSKRIVPNAGAEEIHRGRERDLHQCSLFSTCTETRVGEKVERSEEKPKLTLLILRTTENQSESGNCG